MLPLIKNKISVLPLFKRYIALAIFDYKYSKIFIVLLEFQQPFKQIFIKRWPKLKKNIIILNRYVLSTRDRASFNSFDPRLYDN
jgi:hypothetical protein